MAAFDPNGVGVKGTLFGLPYDVENADIIVIPVPWDVTVSYNSGAIDGPASILEASSQIDYEIPGVTSPWKTKVAMLEIPEMWHTQGIQLRTKAHVYIKWLEQGSPKDEEEEMLARRDEINLECAQLMSYVKQQSAYWQGKGKKTILLGGDHSTPLGHIQACNEKYGEFGILQIDAHADLRKAYEGFTYSHASIIYNVLAECEVSRLVQVGVRDYCEEEFKRIDSENLHIKTFFDQHLKEDQFDGMTWRQQCEEIIEVLPEKVYLTVDIDGLKPAYCPNTGTPVPGGMDTDQLFYLLKKLKSSGKEIVGADLVEVAPGASEWDANVGARVLWRMVQLFN